MRLHRFFPIAAHQSLARQDIYFLQYWTAFRYYRFAFLYETVLEIFSRSAWICETKQKKIKRIKFRHNATQRNIYLKYTKLYLTALKVEKKQQLTAMFYTCKHSTKISFKFLDVYIW